MANVAMTIPYMFLSFAFIYFKKKKEIEKPFEIYKKSSFATAAAIIVTLTVGIANLFTILQPAIEAKDYISTIFQLVGPIVFAAIALILYSLYEKRMANK